MSTLTEPWSGPFGGVPPWDQINPEDFGSAFEHAIEEASREIQAIASNPEPATFENTFVAMERAGAMLDRVSSMFWVHASNLNLGPIPDIQRTVVPKLAAFGDSTVQNRDLFERMRSVHDRLDTLGLDGASTRLVTTKFREFVRQGAELGEPDKARLSELNQRLAQLFTEFSQNVLHDEGQLVTWVSDSTQLQGIPQGLVAGMAAAASERGRPEAWAILNTRSMMDPVLTYATDRSLREQVWRLYYGRGDFAGEHDNKPIITEILRLRAERAALLGYETHAHWRLETTMAKTPGQAMDLLQQVWPKARAQAVAEIEDMALVADHPIEPWDHRFYAEIIRAERYNLDFNDVKPYLQLENLIQAMMWCSRELYGLVYTPIADLDGVQVPGFHPDVRVWRVDDRDGALVGLWYLDPYARAGKSSGAWMTSYRDQQRIDEQVTTLVSNNSNFVKGAAGEPILISWDDARTLFHEFGHALHGLLSNVKFPSQSGTSVTRDYVEFPSQVNEHWLLTDEVLSRFCRHVETDEPMPPEMVERIKAAENFNQGFDTVEYLACALIDMQLHLAGDADIDPAEFERQALAGLEMPEQIVMRHRTPQFSHIFSGDSYSAGYYSYLWADALTADAAMAFEEADGYFDRDVASRLYTHVLSVGDTVDPSDGFRAFRGRDVDTDALLRKRGFPVG